VFVTETLERVGAVQPCDDLPPSLRLRDRQTALRIDRIASAVGMGPVEWTVQTVNPVNASYCVKST
jgi:hypothetical protein